MSAAKPYEIPPEPQQVTFIDSDGTAWARAILKLNPTETAKEWGLTDWEENTLKQFLVWINRLLEMGYPATSADNILALIRLHLKVQFRV